MREITSVEKRFYWLFLRWVDGFATLQVSTFADMEGEETFDPSLLGHADEVVEEHVADDDVIMIKGTKTTSGVSRILPTSPQGAP